MCLTAITKSSPNQKAWQKRWKFFRCISDRVAFTNFSVWSDSLKPNKIYTAQDRDPHYSIDYPKGFHVYRTKREALRSWYKTFKFARAIVVLVPVEVRYIHTEGTELRIPSENLRVDVAKEMRIPQKSFDLIQKTVREHYKHT